LDNKIAALRNMLWQMEVEVGLEELSQPQKDVYYAACLAADANHLVYSDAVKRHPMLAPMARPTFYRALRELVDKGFLANTGRRKDGRYLIQR
jgi:hypothetical protein